MPVGQPRRSLWEELGTGSNPSSAVPVDVPSPPPRLRLGRWMSRNKAGMGFRLEMRLAIFLPAAAAAAPLPEATFLDVLVAAAWLDPWPSTADGGDGGELASSDRFCLVSAAAAAASTNSSLELWLSDVEGRTNW